MKWNKKNVEQYKENESEEFDKQLQELKIESKFDKQLQESEEELKSDSQNNHWLKKDDDEKNQIMKMKGKILITITVFIECLVWWSVYKDYTFTF